MMMDGKNSDDLKLVIVEETQKLYQYLGVLEKVEQATLSSVNTSLKDELTVLLNTLRSITVTYEQLTSKQRFDTINCVKVLHDSAELLSSSMSDGLGNVEEEVKIFAQLISTMKPVLDQIAVNITEKRLQQMRKINARVSVDLGVKIVTPTENISEKTVIPDAEKQSSENQDESTVNVSWEQLSFGFDEEKISENDTEDSSKHGTAE